MGSARGLGTLEDVMDANDALARIDDLLIKPPAGTVAPGPLQDLLFDLWGALQGTPAQREVERWLTLTVERHLFSPEEYVQALREIRQLATLETVE